MKTRLIFLVASIVMMLMTLSTVPAEAKRLDMEPWEEPEWTARYDKSLDAGGHRVLATITAYCPCEKCCGKWARNRPNGIVYTASGAVAEVGVTVAVNPKVIPLGAHILIDGHEYIAQDTGNGLSKGVCVDIYCNSHNEALQIGRQTKTITWWAD